jgi:hypothetical protein
VHSLSIGRISSRNRRLPMESLISYRPCSRPTVSRHLMYVAIEKLILVHPLLLSNIGVFKHPKMTEAYLPRKDCLKHSQRIVFRGAGSEFSRTLITYIKFILTHLSYDALESLRSSPPRCTLPFGMRPPPTLSPPKPFGAGAFRARFPQRRCLESTRFQPMVSILRLWPTR